MDDILKPVRKITVMGGDAPSAPPMPAGASAIPLTPKPKTSINIKTAESATDTALPVASAAGSNFKPLTNIRPMMQPPAQDTKADVSTVGSDLDVEDDDESEAIDQPDQPAEPSSKPAPEKKKTGSNPVSRFFGGYWRKKWWTIPLTLLVIVGIIAAVPQSRYPILAQFMKRSFAVTLTDSKTNTPVSGATVTLDGMTATTDSTGKVKFTTRVGRRALSVTKKYYQSTSTNVFVGISTQHNALSLALLATGRQVPIKVIDKISGQPVANVLVSILDTQARTDSKGILTIVLPTAEPTQAATISADGYSDLKASVEVTSDVVAANTFSLVAAGHVYFLSNLSGKLDVVSTNLDGSDRKTVLAGTGSEDTGNTVLLASRDWQFLALLSKRAGGNHAKLYLINTSNNQLTTMDASTANFTLAGWSDHTFVYQALNDGVSAWQPGQTTLKSFNADTSKVVTIDQTDASGVSGNYIYQNLSFVNLVSDRVVYGLAWSAYYANSSLDAGGKNNSIMSANVDGSNKKDLKDITLPTSTTYTSLNAVLSKPNVLYIQSAVQSQPAVYYSYQYQNNTASQSSTITDATYNQAQQSYTTYLVSPTGKSTFWSQPRDGKNTLFTGDYYGNNAVQVAALSDYAPYGWFTDNYVLVQKGGSELYIMPVAGGTPLKISDYYKPSYSYYGYGGGYGGL